MTIRNSTVAVPTSGNAGIAFSALDRATTRITLDHNTLAGGTFTLAVGDGVTGVTVTGNRFARGAAMAVRWDHPPTGVVWHGNVWADTGAELPPP